MKISRFLPQPLLAAAVLISACAGMPVPAKALTVQEPLVASVGDRIFFDFDSAALRQDAIETIGRQAEYLKSEPDIKVMIEGHTAANEGHTHPRGAEKYNLDLGCRRARALREALIERGIAAERVGIISYGEVRPAVLGANEPAWQQNRRAVLVVADELWRSNCDEP